MAQILSVINQKGGVAKTTTAVNIASIWSQRGQKVLLIDLDPQSSATKSIAGEKEFDETIYDVLIKKATAKNVVQKSEEFGFDFIPAEIMLSGIDIQLAPQYGREKVLRKSLEGLRRSYDSIIIDCSPSLGLLTINALLASSDILIPICPEYFSLKGIELILTTCRNIKTGLGHKVNVKGIAITRYKNRKIAKKVIEDLKEIYGLKVYKSFIPDNIAIEEAHHNHLPVHLYAPSSKASEAYRSLAKELL